MLPRCGLSCSWGPGMGGCSGEGNVGAGELPALRWGQSREPCRGSTGAGPCWAWAVLNQLLGRLPGAGSIVCPWGFHHLFPPDFFSPLRAWPSCLAPGAVLGCCKKTLWPVFPQCSLQRGSPASCLGYSRTPGSKGGAADCCSGGAPAAGEPEGRAGQWLPSLLQQGQVRSVRAVGASAATWHAQNAGGATGGTTGGCPVCSGQDEGNQRGSYQHEPCPCLLACVGLWRTGSSAGC